jgi:hypothetical protein
MSDWKRVPAIFSSAVVVANFANKMRIVFGDTLGKPEDANFHVAVQIDRAGAQLLVNLLQKTLGPQSGGGGGEGSKSGEGGMSVVMGSTAVH